MQSLRIKHKMFAAALAPVVLAAAMLAPAAGASAAPAHHGKSDAPAAARAQAPAASQGFTVYNYSSVPLYLDSLGGDWEGTPQVGSVLKPGEKADFEVQYHFFVKTTDWVRYTTGDYSRKYFLHMEVGGDRSTWAYCDPVGAACSPGPSEGDPFFNRQGNVIVLSDSTDNTVQGKDAQQQLDILKGLCGNGARCTFTPTKEEHVLDDSRYFGYWYANDGPNPVPYQQTIKHTWGESTSLSTDLSFDLSFIKDAQATIRSTYKHDVSQSGEYDEAVNVTVPPYSVLAFTHRAALVKDTGDYTVTFTPWDDGVDMTPTITWHLKDVVFYSPDNTDQKCAEGLASHIRKMTDEERKSHEALSPYDYPVEKWPVDDDSTGNGGTSKSLITGC